jgi:hypothetical protein
VGHTRRTARLVAGSWPDPLAHDADPPKATCSVRDRDVEQFLPNEGWAKLAEGVTDEHYVEAYTSAQSI